jgi:hypothetical protein
VNAPEQTVSAFEKLASINVNEHIEKKNGLSYLSWAWAVDQLLRADPLATWTYSDPIRFGESLMVFCTVKAFGKEMTAQLPVMDHRNKAISNPDSFAVNTAMQRCLAKAIALHGIGLYIYAGEDLPQGANDEQDAFLRDIAAQLVDLVEAQGKPEDAYDFLSYQRLTNDEKEQLWGILKPNSKTRNQIKAVGQERRKPTAEELATTP